MSRILSTMIYDQRKIEIKASPGRVFKQLEINPFPTFRILDTKPFFFLRITLIDGIRTGIRVASDKSVRQKMIGPLEVGSSMGPFTLTEIKRPSRYYLTLKSLFFNCKTGYSLRSTANGSMLSFDIIAKNPKFGERIWWFFIKPIHMLLAHNTLRTIRKKAEHSENR